MHRRLSIFLLAAYVPLSLFLGFLHTDEALVRGAGNVVLHSSSPGSSLRASDTGPCIACLIISGHFIQHDVVLPCGLAVQSFVPQRVSVHPQAAPKAESARAPPDPPSC